MIDDPIVEEVHNARDQIWQELGRDWKELIERWRTMAESHPDRNVGFEQVRRKPEENKGSGQDRVFDD